MIFGAALVRDSEFRINLLSASLPPGMPLGPEGWTIAAKRDNPTQAEEILAVAAAGSWDVGRHCPSYAVGWDVGANNGKGAQKRVRIYYSESATIFGGPFAIGFAEWNDERWVAQNTPCLSATEGWEYANVSEPNVVYYSDQWHMWYSAGPDPINQYAQGYAVSKDGRTNWRRVSSLTKSSVTPSMIRALDRFGFGETPQQSIAAVDCFLAHSVQTPGL